MKRMCLFLLLALLPILLCAQQYEQVMRVVFYNTENFFDPADNPLTDDDDFTPQGARHWGYRRMIDKCDNLARVLIGAGEGRPPAIIGLAEVENDSCLIRLLGRTPLYEWHYRRLITQSPDRRGINVALLYQPDEFRLLGWEPWRIAMPRQIRPTRDMLHAWGRVVSGDTLDVIVCHLPSRLGGAKASAPARRTAHDRLFAAIDSLMHVRHNPNILVMGDMNDMPGDIRIPSRSGMRNLMAPLQRQLMRGRLKYGSHKYQGVWGFLDQMWVNSGIGVGRYPDTEGIEVPQTLWVNHVRAVAFPFMLTDDRTHLGHRPLRSFYGFDYEGGFSDHLPVSLDLHVKY